MKKVLKICILLLMMLNVISIQYHVSAESKQEAFIYVDQTEDVVVMFVFDKEVVDIVFVSPDGTKLDVKNSRVQRNTGNNWASYKISNMEPGQWYVEYDPKGNSEITYSVMDEIEGLWIQNFDVSIDNGSASFEFVASKEDGSISYNYQINAIDEDGEAYIVTDGSSRSENNNSFTTDISFLPSGKYKFRLDITAPHNEIELFDSAVSKEFAFNNPFASDLPVDLVSYVDLANKEITLKWNGIYADCIRITLSDQNGRFDKASIEENTDTYTSAYPVDADYLLVSFVYRSNNRWSPLGEGRIEIKDVISLNVDEVTNSSQIKLSYEDIPADSDLTIEVNKDKSQKKISGSGFFGITLPEKQNEVSISLKYNDNLYYQINKIIYVDDVAPEIIIYDNINGKKINADTFDIIGKVFGADNLKINNTEVALKDDGSFVYQADLDEEENIFVFEATDNNGNLGRIEIKLYRSGTVIKQANSYFYLLCGVGISAFLILLSIILFGKQDKDRKGSYLFLLILVMIVLLAGAVLMTYLLINRYDFMNSLEFVDYAEKSITQASQYIKTTKTMLNITIGAYVFFVLMLVLLVFLKKRPQKKVENQG